MAKRKTGAIGKGRRRPRRKGRSALRRRAGLPDEASIVTETVLTSPTGTRYRILKTTEIDAYDRPAGSKKARK